MNRKNVIRTVTAVAIVVLLGWSFFYFSDDTRGYKPVDTSVAMTQINNGSILGELLVYALPLLLLVGLFVMISRMQGGARMGFGFGKSRAKQLSKDMPKTTFGDVAGVDEAVEELYEIKDRK